MELGGVYIQQIECSLLGPPNSFVMTHLEMFCPNNHILWVKIGFPSGHIKVYPILQGENGQNKPENQQNWNMAKIAPKSDKFTK